MIFHQPTSLFGCLWEFTEGALPCALLKHVDCCKWKEYFVATAQYIMHFCETCTNEGLYENPRTLQQLKIFWKT